VNTRKPPVYPRRFSYFSKKINMEKEEVLKLTNAICKNTLMETLKIEFTDVGADFLTARMPVTKTVYQPDGVLHGGATAALAESVGSAAVFILNKNPKAIVRGIEISANHLKSVKSGYVYATARPINLGKTIQLWEIKVEDDTQQLISICKLTTYTRYKE
jgi:1,4-dihydroxy-2-naphthoyl-CoA hydrolase